MKLPVQSPAVSRWELSDYATDSRTTKPAAGGTAQVSFSQVPDGELWMVERIVVACTSSASTAASIYVGDIRPSGLRDSTPNGNADVADMSSPLQLRSGTELLVQWVGADAGAVGTCNIQYTVLRRNRVA